MAEGEKETPPFQRGDSKVPYKFETWYILELAAIHFSDSIAVIDRGNDSILTYAELFKEATALASWLHEKGLRRGDPYISFIVNLNVNLAARELEYILLDSGATMCFVDTGVASALIEARAAVMGQSGSSLDMVWIHVESDVKQQQEESEMGYEFDKCITSKVSAIGLYDMPESSLDDTFHLYYTSGTTGKPKPVELSHRMVVYHAIGTVKEMKLNALDVWGHMAPMFHLVDVFAIYAITLVGGRHVIMPVFSASDALVMMDSECVSVANIASTMVAMMVNNPLVDVVDFTSLRLLSCGGSPISRATIMQAIALFGCEIFVSYGMTECCGKISMSILPGDKDSLTPEQQLNLVCTSGRPFELINVRIVDENLQDVPRDGQSVGEVIISGPTVFQGYRGLDAANEDAFDECWFHTGDLAVHHPGGYLTVVDRKKEMILVGGENVYPSEVEDVLHSHPAVCQAVAFGVENKVMGELVTAAVTVKPEVVPSSTLGKDLVAWCRERLAEYKVPIAVHIMDALPTTGSGKFLKTELKKMFSADERMEVASSKTSFVAPKGISGMGKYVAKMAGGSLEQIDLESDMSTFGPRVIQCASYVLVVQSLAASWDILETLGHLGIENLVVVCMSKPECEASQRLKSLLPNTDVVLLWLPTSLFECENDRVVRTALSAARTKVPPFAAILYSSAGDMGSAERLDSDIRELVMGTLSKMLQDDVVEQLSSGEPFMSAGVNSTMAVQLVEALQKNLGVIVPGTVIFDYPNLNDLVDYFEQELCLASDQMQESMRTARGVSRIQGTVIQYMKTIIPDAIFQGDPDVDAPLMSMGLNSTMAVQLVPSLATIVGEDLPRTLIFDYPTIREISEYIYSVSGHTSELIVPEPSALVPSTVTAGICSIVSIAGIVPGGNLSHTSYKGNDRITQVPLERWDIDQPPTDNFKELNLQFGSFIEGADLLDAKVFNISPAEAVLMDPQQRLLLTYFLHSWNEFLIEREFTRHTGIFVGVSQLDYARIAYETGSALNTYYATGAHLSVTSGRISYSFGLKGPAMTVDTACSSSLVSTHLAANSMQEGLCTVSATMGTNLALVHSWTRACLRAGMLADDGRCKTLDASADGYVRAEAAMSMILESNHGKDNAQTVKAFLVGTAVNQDGRSSALTAPNGPSQQDVIRSSLLSGGLAAGDIKHLQIHGTGTPLGDPIELGAATAVLLNKASDRVSPLELTSAKSFMGHAEPAAGIVGLSKLTLMMCDVSIEPFVSLRNMNPHVSAMLESKGQTPAFGPRQVMPTGSNRASAFGGVSAFAFQGTNAHAMIQNQVCTGLKRLEDTVDVEFSRTDSLPATAMLEILLATGFSVVVGEGNLHVQDVTISAPLVITLIESQKIPELVMQVDLLNGNCTLESRSGSALTSHAAGNYTKEMEMSSIHSPKAALLRSFNAFNTNEIAESGPVGCDVCPVPLNGFI
eukprot:jgi/Picre1/33777/NNA_001256.t1